MISGYLSSFFFFLLFFIPTTNIIFKHFISSHPLYLCYSLWDQFLLVDIVNLVITRFSPATQFIFHGIVCLQSACMCINFIYACTFVCYIYTKLQLHTNLRCTYMIYVILC